MSKVDVTCSCGAKGSFEGSTSYQVQCWYDAWRGAHAACIERAAKVGGPVEAKEVVPTGQGTHLKGGDFDGDCG